MYFKVRKRFNRILRKYFGVPYAHRRVLSRALKELLVRVPEPVVIETGCIRWLDEGTESTLTIASTLQGAGTFMTFELRPQHIENCRKLCADWNRYITYIQGDSVMNLWRMVREGKLAHIDFAFLDSTNDGDHTWKEFQTIEKCFVPGSVLIVDDVLWADKGRVIVPYIRGSDDWDHKILNVANGMMIARRL